MLFLVLLRLLFLHGTGGSRHELRSALLHVGLQGGDELTTVAEHDVLVLHGQSGTEHGLFLLGNLRFPDFALDTDFICCQVGKLVRLAVYADDGRNDFPRLFINQVHNPSHVAGLTQVPLVLCAELVSLVLVQLLFLADEVGHKPHAAVLIPAEREPCIQLEGLAAESGRHFHQVGLAVIEHLGKVARLFKVFTSYSPFLFQLLPVDFTLVNRLVAFFTLRLFLRVLLFLFHVPFFLLFHIRLLSLCRLPFILGSIEQMGG